MLKLHMEEGVSIRGVLQTGGERSTGERSWFKKTEEPGG